MLVFNVLYSNGNGFEFRTAWVAQCLERPPSRIKTKIVKLELKAFSLGANHWTGWPGVKICDWVVYLFSARFSVRQRYVVTPIISVTIKHRHDMTEHF